MNIKVEKNSRISKLPMVAQPFAVVVREMSKWLDSTGRGFVSNDPYEDYHHRADGMMTRHNDDFILSESYQKAFAASKSAYGNDATLPDIPWRIHQFLFFSSIAQRHQGDIVELGTARGFAMSAVLSVYPDWNHSGKKMWLVDTFEPYHVDQKTGKQDTSLGVHPHYTSSLEKTKQSFSQYQNVEFIKGFIPNCLDQVLAPNISFLHIDLNCAEPEVAGLRYFWDRIVDGGVVLLDDYGYFSGVRHLTLNSRNTAKPKQLRRDQYLQMNILAKELGVEIMATPTGQGIIIK